MLQENRAKQPSSKFKKSLLATSIFALSAMPVAFAQTGAASDEGADQIDEIQVTGIRRNIESAQELKRNAGTVIDSITADELGDFPDKSVAEALMRVPGVMIERFATRTDTGAFSVEPSGVLIRGLPFVRSEFNGRDSFSATSSRGLSWGDVSPELMGGVDIYKNQTAELIEGGISGLVNLRTRLPFDSEKDVKVVTVGGNYSDLSKSSTPELSGIYTTRFDTEIGEFGFMANFAYSDVDATSQSSRIARVNRFRDIYAEDSLYFIPQGVSFSDANYSRQRTGASLALQWQDHEGRFLASLQYNGSQYENTQETRGIETSWGGLGGGTSLFFELTEGGPESQAIIRPAEGTDPFEFFEDGLFAYGTIVTPQGWWGANNEQSRLYAANSNGEALMERCANLDWGGCGEGAVLTTHNGANLGTTGNVSDSKSVTQDLSFNLKWNITDRLHANFDVQQVKATEDMYRLHASFQTWANPEVDLRHSLNSVVLHSPMNVNLVDAGQGVFANPNSYFPASVLEFLGENAGDEFATKADLIFDVESGYIDRIKAGVRYADRDQEVNQASGWHSIANSWAQNAPWFNLDSQPHTGQIEDADGEFQDYTFNGYGDAWVVDSWHSNYGSMSIADGNELFVFPNTDTMRDWKNTMSVMATGQPRNGFYPICSGMGVGSREDEIEGTCFRPAESLRVREETEAFYVQVDFGGEHLNLFDRPITGNIGVRYVKTDITSVGGELFPNFNLSDNPCQETTEAVEGEPETRPPVPFTVSCYLSENDIAFMDNGSNLGTSSVSHHNLLPSFNIKYDLTDKFVTRFALSRAMSRPDIGSLRNYILVNADRPSVDDATGSLWVRDSNGEIIGANVSYTARASNPFLKPTIADQMDISFEYYSGPNSASLALFRKSFDDYVQTGTYIRQMTNKDVTRDVVIDGPINGEGAEMQGFEVQGTHFFNYLPGLWSGLGVQANYTYVDNKGIQNTGVNSGSQDGLSGSSGASDRVQVDQLEGLSKDAYNVSMFFEKNKLSARLSYNWRAEYLVTIQDCCIGTPVWQDDYGQLDASIRYRINDTFEVSLSGSNLTDQKAVLTQQIENSTDGGKRLKYSINQSDTRYTLRLRMQF